MRTCLRARRAVAAAAAIGLVMLSPGPVQAGTNWEDAAWAAWTPSAGLTSASAVASWSAGRLDLFARGQDNALWHRWWNGTAWSGWENLQGVLTAAPAAISWGPNRIDVFIRASDDVLYADNWNGS